MSKLSDAIRRVQRIEAAPMGFGAARATSKATMLVGVLVTVAEAGAAWQGGAETVVIDARASVPSAEEVKKAAADNGAGPLGAWFTSVGREAAAELQKAGLDFILFNADSTPADTLLVEDLGFVLILPDKPEELFLRTLEGLSLDGLLLNHLPSPLTVAGQLELDKIGMLGRRPLFCEVPATASKSDLECLRAAGCALVFTSAAGVAALKETVMSLPPRRQRREERPSVSLPRQQAQAESDEEEDF